MSENIVYGVGVEFTQSGGPSIEKGLGIPGAMSKISDLQKELGGLGVGFAKGFANSLDSVGSAILGTVSAATAAATGALATGFMVATKAGIGFNSMLESAQISLATIQDMQLGTGIESGMKNASKAIAEAQKDAKRLPGEFTDLLTIMKSVSPAAMGTGGAGLDRIEKLSANAMAAAASMGVSYTVAGRQLAATLEGRATSAMAFPLRLGLDRNALKKMTGEQRMTTVETALKKAEPSIDLYSKSWQGLTSTASDTGKQLAGAMAAPLFSAMKVQLDRTLSWADSHNDVLQMWATRLGVGIEWAFNKGVDLAKHWVPIALTFGDNLYKGVASAFQKIEPYAARLGGMIEKFMSNPNALGMIGSAVATGAEMKVAGAGLGASADIFGGLLKAAPALGMSFGEVALAGGAGAAALVAMGAAVYGITDIMLDGSNKWHAGAVKHTSEIEANLTKITGGATSIENLGKSASDAYGAYVLSATSFWTSMLSYVDTFGSLINRYASLLPQSLRADNGDISGNQADARYNMMADRLNPIKNLYLPFEDDSAIKQAHKPPYHVTNINNHVTVRVEPSGDPNRIAKRVGDVIANNKKLGMGDNVNAMFSKR